MAVNPVPIGMFYLTVSPLYPTTVTFLIVKLSITHLYPPILKVSLPESSNPSTVSYSHWSFIIFLKHFFSYIFLIIWNVVYHQYCQTLSIQLSYLVLFIPPCFQYLAFIGTSDPWMFWY